MCNVDNIISTKLKYRLCRKVVQPLDSIKTIVQECCGILNIKEPQIIFCESLTKDFVAFDLKGDRYFIYDSCLMEILYLYNSIMFSGFIESDIDKFFCKLFGEELILQDDIKSSMYFTGKYNNMLFSFDEKKLSNLHAIEHLSLQNYFLIAHELTHLSLSEKNSQGIPAEYRKFVAAAIIELEKQAIKSGESTYDVLFERALYFLDDIPNSADEYFEMLPHSDRFNHFLEECYCDHMGLKLLVEHYEKPGTSINAILSALNCLITLEIIRNELRDQIEHVKDTSRIANHSAYFSLLRTQLLLCTIEISKLDTATALDGIHKRSAITNELMRFIEKLPDKEDFALISDEDIPKIEKTKVINVLIKQLYYISISPNL